MALTKASLIDVNGQELILDADADTSITADTDDQIDIKVGGTDTVVITGGAMALKGATPTLTIGDAGAEDTKIVFDGNAQDYYVGLDDSADKLIIGVGSTVGTTPTITIDESQNFEIAGTMNLLGFTGSKANFTNSMLISNDAGTGTLSSAVNNTGFGHQVFNVLTSGDANTGVGADALSSLTTGSNNTALGLDTLKANTIGHSNTAIGYTALDANVAGNRNTAVGNQALSSCTAASDTDMSNTAVGGGALSTVVSGTLNTAVGRNAGASTTGTANTLMGYASGLSISTGSSNTCVGENAGDAIQSGSNNICIGSGADAAHDAAISITMGIGITGQGDHFKFGKASNVVSNQFTSNASFSRSSDFYKKTNIVDTDIGLSFINELKPITFNWRPNNEFPKHYKDYSETENHMDTELNLYGMIAQDVEKALQKVGHENFGGWSKEEDGSQRLSQEMFIYPLINAVKELSEKCDSLQNEINELKGS